MDERKHLIWSYDLHINDTEKFPWCIYNESLTIFMVQVNENYFILVKQIRDEIAVKKFYEKKKKCNKLSVMSAWWYNFYHLRQWETFHLSDTTKLKWN